MNVREWALPVYTILMQLAVGALFVLWLIRSFASSRFSRQEIERITSNPILVIAFTAIVAMAGAHFHLSRPFQSFLAVLNFKSSWLSREIVFTVLFFLATSYLWYMTKFRNTRPRLIPVIGWFAVLLGVTVVYCMARIYLIPTQVAWNSSVVIISYFTTTLLLGVMTISCLLMLDLRFAEIQHAVDVALRTLVIQYSMVWLTLVVILLILVDISITLYQIHLLGQGDPTAQTSLRLLLELYMPLLVIRFLFLGITPPWLGYSVHRMRKTASAPQQLLLPVYISCLLILVGEIIGRFLFYATHVRVGI
jgi:anaerobic dimethyl sulfoxide reductase subunit C (anchor subunit)